jgi:hypothetical protein
MNLKNALALATQNWLETRARFRINNNKTSAGY